ncbi:MAG: XdhC family protein [Anaerolineae bacterium]
MAVIYELLKQSLNDEKLVALATVVAGPGLGSKLLIWPDGRTEGDLGTAGLNERVLRCSADLLADQRSERMSFPSTGLRTSDVAGETVEVFIDVYPPPPKLIIVGAVHIAIPLVTFAKALGFRTVVVDARSAFATPERFAHADELILKWPAKALQEIDIDESTYIVVLTHDEKLDNPALKIAVESPARFIGALGSPRTHAQRVEKLKTQGVIDEQLNRIHAPIGLDLGAQRPEEIAVSIIAEIVAASHGIGSRQPRPMGQGEPRGTEGN